MISEPQTKRSNAFVSLANNTAFIERISKLITISFFIVLACAITALAFPSLLGAFGERLAIEARDSIAFIYSSGNLKILYMYIAVFLIDVYCLGYKKSALRSVLNPDNSTKTDIFIFILRFCGLWRYVVMLSFFMIGYKVQTLVATNVQTNFLHHVPSYFLQTLVFFLVYDFLGYWRHRYGHRVSWWWAVHRLHHSAEKFNIITVGRSHPVDLALTGIFVSIPMGFLGAPIETFIVFELLKSAQGKLQHSMVDWDFGILGKYVFMSPVAHRVHHSADPIHWDKNFGHFLVIWDRMFGTWYDGKEINTRIGLWGNSGNQKGFVYDVVQAQLEFLALFFSKWKFKVGVLKPHRVPILSQEYREGLEKEGKEQ